MQTRRQAMMNSVLSVFGLGVLVTTPVIAEVDFVSPEMKELRRLANILKELLPNPIEVRIEENIKICEKEQWGQNVWSDNRLKQVTGKDDSNTKIYDLFYETSEFYVTLSSAYRNGDFLMRIYKKHMIEGGEFKLYKGSLFKIEDEFVAFIKQIKDD